MRFPIAITTIVAITATSSTFSTAFQASPLRLPIASTATTTRHYTTSPFYTSIQQQQQHEKTTSVGPLQMSAAAAAAAEPSEGGVSGTGTASIPNEIFNLVKSIVGAGVLSLPAGECGWSCDGYDFFIFFVCDRMVKARCVWCWDTIFLENSIFMCCLEYKFGIYDFSCASISIFYSGEYVPF